MCSRTATNRPCKSLQFCRWFQNFLNQNPGILDLTWFTDEAWFHLSEYINSQNTRIWAETNPYTLQAEPLYAQKIGVWCAVSHRHIISPIYHENTVNSEEYIRIFTDFVNQLTDGELTHGYFQHVTCKHEGNRKLFWSFGHQVLLT